MPFVAARRPSPPASFRYEPTLATAERRVEAMGTTLDLVVRMKYRDEALAASEAALAEVRRVEALLTTWKPGGELWRVDEGSAGQARRRLERARRSCSRPTSPGCPRTQGAFDPTVPPLIRAWDLRGKGRIPTPAALAAARKASGVDHFRIDASAHSVTRLAADAGIDEGAWGKGYALELADRVLRKAGVASAVARPRRPGARRRQRRERTALARAGRGPAGPRRRPSRSSAWRASPPRPRATPSAAASSTAAAIGHILDPAHGRARAGLRLGHASSRRRRSSPTSSRRPSSCSAPRRASRSRRRCARKASRTRRSSSSCAAPGSRR